MWITTSTSPLALLQPVEHVARRHEVGDRVLGDVAPLAEVGLAQTVADHHVERRVLGQLGDDVGADEAGPAGDEDDASRSWPPGLGHGRRGRVALDEGRELHLAAPALDEIGPDNRLDLDSPRP